MSKESAIVQAIETVLHFLKNSANQKYAQYANNRLYQQIATIKNIALTVNLTPTTKVQLAATTRKLKVAS
jgi:hypothetical protein